LLPAAWEPTLCALAHALRKLQRYDEAEQLYRRAISLNPSHASSHSALGFTLQLQGRSQEAAECYHTALGLNLDDTFAAEMLAVALKDDEERFYASLEAGGAATPMT
jgi:anaphase-promoting complex subunit 6